MNYKKDKINTYFLKTGLTIILMKKTKDKRGTAELYIWTSLS